MATVGENIARIREALMPELTQVGLADRLKVRQPSVWKLEHAKGKGLPNLKTLFKVAKALECSVESLIEKVDEAYDIMRHQLPDIGSATTGKQIAEIWPQLREADRHAIVNFARLRLSSEKPAAVETPQSGHDQRGTRRVR